MKAGTIGYLIDPMNLTVRRVKLGGWRDINRWLKIDCFDIVRINAEGDCVFVDDSGLLKRQHAGNFFKLDTYPDPLAGRGLVLGTDFDGESIDPSIPWEQFKKLDMVKQVTVVFPRVGLTQRFQYIDEIGEQETACEPDEPIV